MNLRGLGSRVSTLPFSISFPYSEGDLQKIRCLIGAGRGCRTGLSIGKRTYLGLN